MTYSFTDLVVDGLATQRINRLVIEDRIFDAPRNWLLDRFHPSDTKLGYLITCPHCVSVWGGAAVTVMRMGSESRGSRRSAVVRCTLGVLRYTLAASGAVSLGNEIAGKLPPTL